MNPIVKHSKTIATVPFVVGQSQIKFNVPQELKQLSDQRILTKAIQIFTTTLLAAFDGLVPMTAANLLSLTLHLQEVGGPMVIIDLPAAALLRASNGGFYYVLDNLAIDYSESFFKVQSAAGVVVNTVIPIEVIY